MDAESQPVMPSDDDSDAPVRLNETHSHADGNGHLPAGMDAAGMDAAGNVNAQTVNISQGGAAQVRAEQMSVSQGGVALARTGSLNINEGGSAFAVMSDKATINEGGNVLVLVASEVSGDAKPLLDWRSALALATGLVIAWRVVRRIF
jgi:hypothetical protein